MLQPGDAATRWLPLVATYLEHFAASGLRRRDVDRAEAHAMNASVFYATGSWRAKIVSGELWVRFIRGHEGWAERVGVLQLVLLAARAHRLPDLEFVYEHADNDNTPMRRLSPPIFTNSFDPEHGGLPLPDFTWLGWQHNEPWCRQAPTLAAAAAASPWDSRDPRAFFSGDLTNGRPRKQLMALRARAAARGAASMLDVRHVPSKFGRIPQFDRASNRSGIAADAPLPPRAACGYQHSLSLPGFGYSSRLRSLLQCGSAVLHVDYRAPRGRRVATVQPPVCSRVASCYTRVPARVAARHRRVTAA